MVRWFENSCTGCGCETESKGVAKTKSGFRPPWWHGNRRQIKTYSKKNTLDHVSTAVCLLARRGKSVFFLSFFLEFFFFLFRQRATLGACFYAISERNAARKNRKNTKIQGFFLWEVFSLAPISQPLLIICCYRNFKKRPPSHGIVEKHVDWCTNSGSHSVYTILS